MELQLERRLSNRPHLSRHRPGRLLYPPRRPAAGREVLQRMNLLSLSQRHECGRSDDELLKRMRGTKSNEEFLASMTAEQTQTAQTPRPDGWIKP